jgi:hypothetical protein
LLLFAKKFIIQLNRKFSGFLSSGNILRSINIIMLVGLYQSEIWSS